jgi:hypothetical protein
MSKDRLAEARWVFERQLAWISAAEVKVGVIVPVQVAMLAGLGAIFSGASKKSSWAIGSSVVCVTLVVVAVLCAAMTVMPRIRGPAQSMLFFGKIQELSEADYVDRFQSASDEELLADWTAQIHRNAQIANDKHDWVRKAVMFSFMSVLPWLLAIGLLTA